MSKSCTTRDLLTSVRLSEWRSVGFWVIVFKISLLPVPTICICCCPLAVPAADVSPTAPPPGAAGATMKTS
ncbi:hypothetical protein PR202_ga10854 [Eleusine coracana subsp. coracana]|uniref:Uncharacterized protein n=1 Tax=Eleusine coracana subsp. coracana TaxID=191504 RepID=A0AAV5C7V2_ELECO|nr:hypothetical protein PR202_ga10854 [Eleusine coracana subsp. coracana]